MRRLNPALAIYVSTKMAMSIASLIFCMLVAVGCNQEPQLIHVKGTITFRDKPVPHGIVVIHPDQTKGNSGPSGYSAIRNGQFDTSRKGGVGVTPGFVKFFVGGSETRNESREDSSEGLPLFPTYEYDADVRPDNTTFDIKVPD